MISRLSRPPADDADVSIAGEALRAHDPTEIHPEGVAADDQRTNGVLARGPEVFIAIVHAIGTPFAHVLGWATIVVEITGESPILLGARVPAAAVPMIVVLLVAICTVHLPYGFSSIKLLSYRAARAHFG